MTYPPESIRNWILTSFAVAAEAGDELKFACPKCGHDNFYFNTKKKIGWCHRAKCHYRPTLKTLIDLIGFGPGPSQASGLFFGPGKKTPESLSPKVEIPEWAWAAYDDETVRRSLYRRGIDYQKIHSYDIECDRDFIFIPVREKGKLVNIVQRRISRGSEDIFNVPHKQRYLYVKGVRTTDYLFDWDVIKRYETLTLVENTFNAIAMNPGNNIRRQSIVQSMVVSTNFGSHLSDRQAELIKNSNVKQVLILWDEGAPATKAIEKLKKIGVRAESFSLAKGQPDDYKFSDWNHIILEAHKAILCGEYSNFIERQPLSMRYKIDL